MNPLKQAGLNLALGLSLIAAAFGAAVGYHHLTATTPHAATAVDGSALGRKYASLLVGTFADGWLAAANTLEAGKPIKDAMSALQNSWQDARGKAFEAQVSPELAKVLPEGSEPGTAAQRAETVQLWRDFAAGLRKGVR